MYFMYILYSVFIIIYIYIYSVVLFSSHFNPIFFSGEIKQKALHHRGRFPLPPGSADCHLRRKGPAADSTATAAVGGSWSWLSPG